MKINDGAKKEDNRIQSWWYSQNEKQYQQKVQSLLYSNFKGNKATHYGTAKEQETRQEYITYQQRNGHPDLSVETCGLFISLTTPWLAASPDGTVYDPKDASQVLGLVEIKNPPYSMRDKTLDEACKTSTFCLDDKHKLKRRHDYYYQIQCQFRAVYRNFAKGGVYGKKRGPEALCV